MSYYIAAKACELLKALGHAGDIIRTGTDGRGIVTYKIRVPAPWVRADYTLELTQLRELHGFRVDEAEIKKLQNYQAAGVC